MGDKTTSQIVLPNDAESQQNIAEPLSLTEYVETYLIPLEPLEISQLIYAQAHIDTFTSIINAWLKLGQNSTNMLQNVNENYKSLLDFSKSQAISAIADQLIEYLFWLKEFIADAVRTCNLIREIRSFYGAMITYTAPPSMVILNRRNLQELAANNTTGIHTAEIAFLNSQYEEWRISNTGMLRAYCRNVTVLNSSLPTFKMPITSNTS